MDQVLDMYTALKRMRELTEAGSSFKIEFRKLSGELCVVDKAIIRPGYGKKFSTRGKFLVAYEDLSKVGKYRQFHRSLLMKLNDIEIKR